MSNTADILSTLSRARLLEIVQVVGIDGLTGEHKAAIRDALLKSRRVTQAELLDHLKREESKAACRQLGLDDSGRAKQPIIDRLLGGGGEGESGDGGVDGGAGETPHDSNHRRSSASTGQPDRSPPTQPKPIPDDHTPDAPSQAAGSASGGGSGAGSGGDAGAGSGGDAGGGSGGATASNGAGLRLGDAEKQDIIHYLDADKPLPEKYRFLTFED